MCRGMWLLLADRSGGAMCAHIFAPLAAAAFGSSSGDSSRCSGWLGCMNDRESGITECNDQRYGLDLRCNLFKAFRS